MPAERRGRPWLLGRGAVATVGAVVANGLVLRAGVGVVDLPAPYLPGAPGPVVVPAAAGVAATLLYAHLDRTGDGVSRRFSRLVAGGLVVSFAPILVAAATFELGPGGVTVLVAQHVAVAVTIAVAFRRRDGAGLPARSGRS